MNITFPQIVQHNLISNSREIGFSKTIESRPWSQDISLGSSFIVYLFSDRRERKKRENIGYNRRSTKMLGIYKIVFSFDDIDH
jgi:hypothetical protein